MHKLAVVPGDGIGPEVTEAALTVLDGLEVKVNYDYAAAGEQCFQDRGTTIPPETIELAKKTDVTLFGAVTTVPGQKSAIITLRKELDLYANLRPVKSYPGINSLYSDLNFLIVRENTEGLYSGREEYTKEGAQALRVITRTASRRICDFAFQQAKSNGFNLVTAVHKANVLKKTDGIFKDTFYQVAEKYNDIMSEDLYVDAVAMFMVNQPQRFQVIVTTNLFGDILSDEGAGLVGGMGMVPSANIGDENALFEPVHGSAPDIAGKGVANPTAMLLSLVLMLKHLGENYEAFQLEKAILSVLKEGKVVTPDLGGQSSTMEMAVEIKSKIDLL
ncbi:MAG TPA: homoisocitrate dehydrogenase [Methanobacteriaceae archaeon]|nr:homoisocitrate dehydrogenase [Methanobacteriaceae archaeon]